MIRPASLAIAVMALATVAAPAWADDVLYKCQDAKGAISIQSDPCPKASKEVWKRDAAAMAAQAKTMPAPSVTGAPAPRPPASAGPPGRPDPRPPPPERSLPAASVESLAPIGPPAAPPPSPPISACDHARDFAAELRDMPWLELSHDQQQKLLGWVMEQCRHGSSEQE